MNASIRIKQMSPALPGDEAKQQGVGSPAKSRVSSKSGKNSPPGSAIYTQQTRAEQVKILQQSFENIISEEVSSLRSLTGASGTTAYKRGPGDGTAKQEVSLKSGVSPLHKSSSRVQALQKSLGISGLMCETPASPGCVGDLLNVAAINKQVEARFNKTADGFHYDDDQGAIQVLYSARGNSIDIDGGLSQDRGGARMTGDSTGKKDGSAQIGRSNLFATMIHSNNEMIKIDCKGVQMHYHDRTRSRHSQSCSNPSRFSSGTESPQPEGDIGLPPGLAQAEAAHNQRRCRQPGRNDDRTLYKLSGPNQAKYGKSKGRHNHFIPSISPRRQQAKHAEDIHQQPQAKRYQPRKTNLRSLKQELMNNQYALNNMQKLSKANQQIEPVDMTNYNSMLPKNLSKNLMSSRQIKKLQGSGYTAMAQNMHTQQSYNQSFRNSKLTTGLDAIRNTCSISGIKPQVKQHKDREWQIKDRLVLIPQSKIDYTSESRCTNTNGQQERDGQRGQPYRRLKHGRTDKASILNYHQMTQSKEGSKPSITLASGGMAFHTQTPGRLQPTPNEDISHFSSVDYETAQMPQTALQIEESIIGSQGLYIVEGLTQQAHRNGAKSRSRDHVSFDGKAVATQLQPRSEESYKAEPFTATLPRDHDVNGTDQFNTNTPRSPTHTQQVLNDQTQQAITPSRPRDEDLSVQKSNLDQSEKLSFMNQKLKFINNSTSSQSIREQDHALTEKGLFRGKTEKDIDDKDREETKESLNHELTQLIATIQQSQASSREVKLQTQVEQESLERPGHTSTHTGELRSQFVRRCEKMMQTDSTRLKMETLVLTNSPKAVQHKKFGVRHKSVSHNQGPQPLFKPEGTSPSVQKKRPDMQMLSETIAANQKRTQNQQTKSPAPFEQVQVISKQQLQQFQQSIREPINLPQIKSINFLEPQVNLKTVAPSFEEQRRSTRKNIEHLHNLVNTDTYIDQLEPAEERAKREAGDWFEPAHMHTQKADREQTAESQGVGSQLRGNIITNITSTFHNSSQTNFPRTPVLPSFRAQGVLINALSSPATARIQDIIDAAHQPNLVLNRGSKLQQTAQTIQTDDTQCEQSQNKQGYNAMVQTGDIAAETLDLKGLTNSLALAPFTTSPAPATPAQPEKNVRMPRIFLKKKSVDGTSKSIHTQALNRDIASKLSNQVSVRLADLGYSYEAVGSTYPVNLAAKGSQSFNNQATSPSRQFAVSPHCIPNYQNTQYTQHYHQDQVWLGQSPDFILPRQINSKISGFAYRQGNVKLQTVVVPHRNAQRNRNAKTQRAKPAEYPQSGPIVSAMSSFFVGDLSKIMKA